MKVKKLNEDIKALINSIKEEIATNPEIEALADYLEIPVEQIEQEEMHYAQYFYGLLNTYKVKMENEEQEEQESVEEQEYYVTDSYKNVKKAVEESVEGLFTDLRVNEFIEKIVPYLPNDASYYITGLNKFDTYCWGREYPGKFNAKRMAQDVIDTYGPGHELASYDNRTIEHDYKGKTYYIFRNN